MIVFVTVHRGSSTVHISTVLMRALGARLDNVVELAMGISVSFRYLAVPFDTCIVNSVHTFRIFRLRLRRRRQRRTPVQQAVERKFSCVRSLIAVVLMQVFAGRGERQCNNRCDGSFQFQRPAALDVVLAYELERSLAPIAEPDR